MMSQAKLDVSVVICAYTEERWYQLVASVRSVEMQSTPPCEIIVVIDHNPRLLERARNQIASATVTVIPNSEMRGLSGARNSALAIVRGEIIAFLDEDAVAARDWLELLTSRYDDSNVLGVGGSIEPAWVQSRPQWFPEEFDWVVGCTYRGMPSEASPVRNLIGCNMSMRRELFDTIGGFTNGIGRVGTRPVGCEETELCIRATRHYPEGRFIYEPRARVRHRVPENRASWRYFWSRCYAEGLSKAAVARLVGADRGLATERTYTSRTLPLGVARGAKEALLRADASGIARGGAILAGLGVTVAGYFVGSIVPATLELPRPAVSIAAPVRPAPVPATALIALEGD